MATKSVKDEINDIKLSIDKITMRIVNLENDSHPPVFNRDTYEILDARLQVIEAFYNNIKLITTQKKEIM